MNIVRKLYEQKRDYPAGSFAFIYLMVGSIISFLSVVIGIMSDSNGAFIIGTSFWVCLLIACLICVMDFIIEKVSSYITCDEKTIIGFFKEKFLGEDFFQYSELVEENMMFIASLTVLFTLTLLPLLLLILLSWSMKLYLFLFLLGVGVIFGGMKIARMTYIANKRINDHITDPDAHKRNQ